MTLDFDALVRTRPRVLIFIPNTNELQRFVLAGAFADLNALYDIHYVVPTQDADKMRAAAPDELGADNTHELDVPNDRYKIWAGLFQAACVRFSGRSQSFAIRANLDIKSKTGRLIRALPPSWWPLTEQAVRLAEFMPGLPRRIRKRLRQSADALQRARSTDDLEFLKGAAYQDLISSTFSTLEPLPKILNLFERFRPLFVIVPSSLLDLFCNDVLFACEREGVASIVLQSGWDNLSSKGIIHQKPTVLGCWGPQSRWHALDIQKMDDGTAIDLGAPHYEFLNQASAKECEKFRAGLGVKDHERLLLFGGSFRQFDETGTLIRLDQAIEAGRLPAMKILYRPHPWRADRQDEDDFFQHAWKHVVFDPDMQERYVRAREERGFLKRQVPMYDMAYLALLLSSVQAVVSPMSTLLIEALFLKRPTLAIAFGDGKHAHNPSVTAQMTHFYDIRNSGALRWCRDSESLEKHIVQLFEEASNASFESERVKLLAKVVTTAPGTYASRLSSLCHERVDRVARHARAGRTNRRRGTISNAYGANLIARDYAGLDLTNPDVPGYWMHGWIPGYHNVDPSFIALHKKDGQDDGYDYERQIAGEKLHTPQWVSRSDQADYLISNGYQKVRAIGLPVVYLPEITVPRIPGSLLVMPPHSHKSHGEGDPLAESYADAIADIRSHFDRVLVCLHEDDIAKGQWIESFRRRGIEVFPSADQSDPFTLLRLKRILSSFEYVTTNGYGSHIAYAAYWGAKVSVFGSFAEFPRQRMARTHSVKMFPDLLDKAYWLCTEEALRQHCDFLFTNPLKAVAMTEWGEEQVGEPCRLSPAELGTLFGWNSAEDNNSQRV